VNLGGVIVAMGGVMVAMGAVLPWSEVAQGATSLPVSPMAGLAGRVALGAGATMVLVGVANVTGRGGRGSAIVGMVAGWVAVAIAMAHWVSVSQASAEMSGTGVVVRVGTAIPLMMLGGILGTIGAVGFSRRSSEP
jgi:hypothetical protein